jgi:hypothetical protein
MFEEMIMERRVDWQLLRVLLFGLQPMDLIGTRYGT